MCVYVYVNVNVNVNVHTPPLIEADWEYMGAPNSAAAK